MNGDDQYPAAPWEVERRSILNQLRSSARAIETVQATVTSTRESLIGLGHDIKTIREGLTGTSGLILRVDALEAKEAHVEQELLGLVSLQPRVSSLETSRTWIKGVMATVAVGWSLALLYLGSLLR